MNHRKISQLQHLEITLIQLISLLLYTNIKPFVWPEMTKQTNTPDLYPSSHDQITCFPNSVYSVCLLKTLFVDLHKQMAATPPPFLRPSVPPSLRPLSPLHILLRIMWVALRQVGGRRSVWQSRRDNPTPPPRPAPCHSQPEGVDGLYFSRGPGWGKREQSWNNGAFLLLGSERRRCRGSGSADSCVFIIGH